MRACLMTTSTTVHQMGGTEVHAEALAAEAARQGHEVFVVTAAHPSGLKEETRDGCRVFYLPGTSHRMSRGDLAAWWRGSAAFTSALCAEKKIDVVWAENFSGLSYAALPRRQRRPVISVVNGMGFRGEVASNFNRVSSPGELLYFLTRYAAQALFYYRPWFKAMARDSDLLVGVSRESAAAMRQEFPVCRDKTITILNGIDTALFRPDLELRRSGRAALGLKESDTVVLMAGVLHKQKGVHLGLRAFAGAAAGLPQTRLVVAGDGPQLHELLALSGRLGLSRRAVFCGKKNNAEMPAIYNAADIFLNPTLRMEGISLVMLEAAACGLPMLASSIGGTPSAMDEGKGGFFTEPGDLPAITRKLAELLNNSELRARLSKGARHKAEKSFDIRETLKEYVAASAALLREDPQRLP